MEVRRSRAVPDGEILILGVDELALPEALRPSGPDLLVQGLDSRHWGLVAARPADWARFGADAVRKVPAGTVAFRTPPAAGHLADFVRGWRLGGSSIRPRAERRTLLVDEVPDFAQTQATLAARELVNTPSNVKSPAWMVTQARRLARQAGAQVDVLGLQALRRGGFGGVLAVGGASASPPRVVIASKPGRGPRIVLVGKGVTFDSGGLSLKPREAMALMKTDMAGAAAVLSALPLIPAGMDVTVLVGLAENALGADSYRPGDVITHVDGTTTEVRNTDAEGRLILADLLAYARADLQPDVMVDVATLTGAATLALSREYGALYATTPALRDGLRAAGDRVREPLWPLPLVAEYAEALTSGIADRCHIPTRDVGAGSITAALFLQQFVGDVPWAHLDIAGPARATAASGLRQPGGTGFGAALLGQWLAGGAPGSAATSGPRRARRRPAATAR
jgi:leucyl aminopeptidase